MNVINKPIGAIKDELRKLVRYRKNVNDQWEASLKLGDGYTYSYAAYGKANVAKAHAREKVIDAVLKQSEHPLPIK